MGIKILDLGVVFILLLAIGLGSLVMLFQPATIRYEPVDQYGMIESSFDGSFKSLDGLAVYAPAATTDLGMALRGRAWIVYPTYTAGLIIIMVLSFAGAIYAANAMIKLKNEEID